MGRPDYGLERLEILVLSKYCISCLSFVCGGSSSIGSNCTSLWVKSPYRAGRFEGSVQSLKVKWLDESTIAIAVAGEATQDGTLYNSRKAGCKRSTAREHESLPVRYWNKHLSEESNTIWYLTLQKMQSTESAGKSHYVLSPEGPINALKGTGLQSPTLKETDNSGDFDISTKGIIFIARNPDSDPTKHFGSNLYYIPTNSLVRNMSTKPRMIEVSGFTGACESPVFSPDGTSVAFVKTKEGAAWYGQSASVRYPQHRRKTFSACSSPRSLARSEGLASFATPSQVE